MTTATKRLLLSALVVWAVGAALLLTPGLVRWAWQR